MPSHILTLVSPLQHCVQKTLLVPTRTRGTPYASLIIGALCVASRVAALQTQAEKATSQSFLHTAKVKNTTTSVDLH